MSRPFKLYQPLQQLIFWDSLTGHGEPNFEEEQINASYTEGQQSQDRTK
jgi:hypothetical protein